MYFVVVMDPPLLILIKNYATYLIHNSHTSNVKLKARISEEAIKGFLNRKSFFMKLAIYAL